jgi:hypothetical protein
VYVATAQELTAERLHDILVMVSPVVVRGGRDSLEGIAAPTLVEGEDCFKSLIKDLLDYEKKDELKVNVCHSVSQKVIFICVLVSIFWHVCQFSCCDVFTRYFVDQTLFRVHQSHFSRI